MSENVVNPPTQTPLSPELQQHFAMAFGDPMPEPGAPNPPTPDVANPLPASVDTNAAPIVPATPTPDADVTYVDPNEYLKQQLGFDNWELAKAEVERLRQMPATPAEIKYANDESKRWAQYFQQGKEEELYQALHARQQVKNLDALNDEQKMKLYLKMQNPLFDQELIDYQYQKDYGFNEASFKDEDGAITDPMALKFAKVAAMQRLQNDLSKANDYFTTYRTKIELPELTPAAVNNTVDEDYEAFKASTAQNADFYNNQIVPGLKSISEADLNMTFNINDPNNQMSFDFGINIDKEDMEAARQNALRFDEWVTQSFYDENGTFQPKNLVQAILLQKNFGKYAQSIARQAVNAERKRELERETGNPFGRRDYNINPAVKTEVDKHMEMAFSV